MESELRSLIHLMVARHATDAHLTLRFGRLTLRLRCPERMIDDDSGMFDGRLLHYLKYISHLDLGAMSTPQSGSFTRQYPPAAVSLCLPGHAAAADRRAAPVEPAGSDPDRRDLQ